MALKFIPHHRTPGSSVWVPGSQQDGPMVQVPNLPPSELREFMARRFDTETGLVSLDSNIIQATPLGSGGVMNPSPYVSWDRPSAENTGPDNPPAITVSTQYRFETETELEDINFQGGAVIAGAPRDVHINNFMVTMNPGQGGNVLNDMLYGLTAEASFAAGGRVILNSGSFYGASSTSLYCQNGIWQVEGVHFIDTGGDHTKGNRTTGNGSFFKRCYFERMSNSWLNRGYNDPGNANAYHNLAYIHGDSNQWEDLAPGVLVYWFGNSFDLLGTYHPNGVQPSHPGWPIGPYNAAFFCLSRNFAVQGTSTEPPFWIDGNWIKGATIPIRMVSKNGLPNTHWRVMRNILEGGSEYHPMVYHSSVNTTSGNVWHEDGRNIDDWLLNGSGVVPPPLAA